MAQKRGLRFSIHNRRTGPIYFVLEPLGEVHRMPTGAIFEVVSEENEVEVSLEEDLVKVWGENYAVRCDGVELSSQDQIDLDAERKALPTETKR
jgi:hypothetical protein